MLTSLFNAPGFIPGLLIGALLGAVVLLAFLRAGDAFEDRAFRKALERSQ